jgi:methionyl-tRNA formyltransferase
LSRALKVGFAGTPEFARTALLALLESRHRVALVLTQPDRPSGRGMKLTPGPVKRAAQSAGVTVLQPHGLRLDGRFGAEAHEAHQLIASAGLDVLVVAAYGLILPQSVLDLPASGCFNIHASLLPRWRGAAPVQRAIEAGDLETGVCIMQMDAGLDTGAVLLRARCPIEAGETAGSLTDKLARMGATALLESLEQCAAGTLSPEAQSEHDISYASKIKKSEALLDWTLQASRLERLVRAFDPVPGACATHGAETFKIWRTRVADAALLGAPPAPPGSVVFAGAEGIGVACGAGVLVLLELQRPGGRRVSAAQFLDQVALPVGAVLQ